MSNMVLSAVRNKSVEPQYGGLAAQAALTAQSDGIHQPNGVFYFLIPGLSVIGRSLKGLSLCQAENAFRCGNRNRRAFHMSVLSCRATHARQRVSVITIQVRRDISVDITETQS